MTRTSKNAILGAAAKTLAWGLYAEAGYARTRARVNVEHFDRELRSAARQWSRAHKNLNKERSSANGKENV